MPAKKDDMDEVVSSIRRLVGDREPSETDGAVPDRLVLSPEHRVSDVGVLTLQPGDAVHVPEPDAKGRAPRSGEPSDQSDVSADTETSDKGAFSAPPQPGADGETSPEDDILDEAALRALVAEIVRAELQGVLGERITRNVRKLVRREIDRVLAARDLN